MGKIAIAIRGHERGAMTDSEFSDAIFDLSKTYESDIFIHTWNLSEASSSWRNVPDKRFNITEEKIRQYFYRNEIKKIFIEDDEDIELHGRVFGKLGALTEVSISPRDLSQILIEDLGDWSKKLDLKLVSANHDKIFCFLQYGCPILPWKRMWHGIYTVVDFINKYDNYDLILNIRFDILRYKKFFNPGSPLVNLEVIHKLIQSSKQGNLFTFMKKHKASCIDNIYTAEPLPLLMLCQRFHFTLDELVKSYHPKDWAGIQEHLVFLEAERIKNSLNFNKNIV
jgi:hypothetical protein